MRLEKVTDEPMVERLKMTGECKVENLTQQPCKRVYVGYRLEREVLALSKFARSRSTLREEICVVVESVP